MRIKIVYILLAALLLVSSLSLFACNEPVNEEDSMYLFLVNKSNPVDKDYAPTGLVTVNKSYTTGGKVIELEAKTAEAVIKMIDAMKAEGISGVTVTSGYRTYAYQEMLFNRYFAEEQDAHPTWSDAQVEAQVLSYSAAPGTSEHHTGLCLDLFTNEMLELENYGYEGQFDYDKGFAETEAFAWLQENAHKYGFILRFPENKTDITGYSYESWHYRYVGVEHATKIHEKGITLEEYLESLQ